MKSAREAGKKTLRDWAREYLRYWGVKDDAGFDQEHELIRVLRGAVNEAADWAERASLARAEGREESAAALAVARGALEEAREAAWNWSALLELVEVSGESGRLPPAVAGFIEGCRTRSTRALAGMVVPAGPVGATVEDVKRWERDGLCRFCGKNELCWEGLCTECSEKHGGITYIATARKSLERRILGVNAAPAATPVLAEVPRELDVSEAAWCRRNLMVDFVDEQGRRCARPMTQEELIQVAIRLHRERVASSPAAAPTVVPAEVPASLRPGPRCCPVCLTWDCPGCPASTPTTSTPPRDDGRYDRFEVPPLAHAFVFSSRGGCGWRGPASRRGAYDRCGLAADHALHTSTPMGEAEPDCAKCDDYEFSCESCGCGFCSAHAEQHAKEGCDAEPSTPTTSTPSGEAAQCKPWCGKLLTGRVYETIDTTADLYIATRGKTVLCSPSCVARFEATPPTPETPVVTTPDESPPAPAPIIDLMEALKAALKRPTPTTPGRGGK